jgi:hypothetical protein
VRALGATINGKRRECVVAASIIWREITTVFKGRVVRGSYAVENGTVKVKTAHSEKATQLKGTNAIWAAGRLLRELASEGKAQAERKRPHRCQALRHYGLHSVKSRFLPCLSRCRPSMYCANTIAPKMNRQSTTNTTKLFVGIGTFSGRQAVKCIGDVFLFDPTSTASTRLQKHMPDVIALKRHFRGDGTQTAGFPSRNCRRFRCVILNGMAYWYRGVHARRRICRTRAEITYAPPQLLPPGMTRGTDRR